MENIDTMYKWVKCLLIKIKQIFFKKRVKNVYLMCNGVKKCLPPSWFPFFFCIFTSLYLLFQMTGYIILYKKSDITKKNTESEYIKFKKVHISNNLHRLHLLFTTGPAFIFTQMTLRIWTPTAQVMVPFWRLVPLRAIEVSSIHGPHAEASQWNTTQGWSLQTLHCSRAGPAGQAFPSVYQHIRVENCEIHRMYNMAFRKSCTKSLQHSFIIMQSTCDLTKTNLMDSLKVQDVFDQWK